MKLSRLVTMAVLTLSALSAGAMPAAEAATTPPGGGAPYYTLGCSAWKQGGLAHNDPQNPYDVTYFNAVTERTCLRHRGTTMYAMTEWYSPNGGYHVGVIYANVQDCGTGRYGPDRLTEHPSRYYGPKSASTADKTYSGQTYGTSGHTYRAKGYMSGTLTIRRTYNLQDSPTIHNVNVRTGCYRV